MMPRLQSAKRIDLGAAFALAVGLVAVAGLQLYRTLGGTWAVHASSGGAYSEATTALRGQAAAMAVAAE